MMGTTTTDRGQAMRFEIAKSKSKKEPFYWRLVANNGQTLATSEMYTRKASCRKAIASVRKNMTRPP
jgi:hypothetical protein